MMQSSLFGNITEIKLTALTLFYGTNHIIGEAFQIKNQ